MQSFTGSRSQAVVHRHECEPGDQRGAPISLVSQRSSEVIISHCAIAIRGTQRSSGAITGHKGQLEALRGTQRSSGVIRAHQSSSHPMCTKQLGLVLGRRQHRPAAGKLRVAPKFGAARERDLLQTREQLRVRRVGHLGLDRCTFSEATLEGL